MNELKLLLVEDSPEDIEVCRSTVRRYERQKECSIKLVVSNTTEEALSQINKVMFQ